MEIVVGALPSLLPKLADLLIGEYNLQKEVKGGIIFLQAELESMKVALEKISETPAEKLDKQDKLWARDVRELSYDIEDKIDMFMVRFCKAGSKVAEAEQHGFKKAIDRSLNWLMRPNIRRKIAIDIRDIKSHVLEVHERRCRYEVNNQSVDKPVKVDPRVLVRYEETAKLVGIDEARDEVIKILMQGNEVSKQHQDKTVSIVGFGGLGKTTLANVVYEKLREEFDCSAFVSVSQTPDMEKLFNYLLYQLNKTYYASKNKVIAELSEPLWEKRYGQLYTRNNASINNVIDELREFLWEKRYLIVMDDIWDISVWKIIKCALTNNNGGCKIITTTRIIKVAEEVGGAYKMRPLCLQSSRILLYRRIFGNKGKDKCPDEELAKVSERILIKCAGVPLAIITVASLLANKGRNKLDWYEVYNSIGTGMENNTDMESMRKVLLPSYFNLPSHIKTCMLYLSVFPEDYEIDRRRLIWMWIAEGFIQGGKQGQSLFEVGESYFNELVNRNMIQPVYDRHGMKILSCRVHDMVLDLIHSMSSEKNYVTVLNDVGHKSAQQKVRRLCLHNDDKVGHATHGTTLSMQQVRSMVAFSSAIELIPALSRFEVVRVLHLQNCDLSHGYNLNLIGKLVHLRYLGLRYTKIAEVPEEIGNLQFLQMLDISNNALSTLPLTIVQLRQLKCLYIDLAGLESNSCIGRLTSLEELSLSYIHHVNATELVAELGHLTELRVLHITYLGINEPRDVLVECLHKLQKIETLSIDFLGCIGKLDGWVIGPQSLRSLQVDGCSFLKLPVWINHSQVQNLSFLVICVEELQPEDLEVLGRLPALTDLDMYSTKRHSNVSREFVIGAGLFPCLVRCKLRGYYERVVFWHRAMPCLTSLELDTYWEVWSTWTGVPDLGFENLSSLLELHVGLQHGCGSTAAEQAIASLMNMAEIHPNRPSVSVSCYYQYL